MPIVVMINIATCEESQEGCVDYFSKCDETFEKCLISEQESPSE
ncbi:hypothetical protein [Sulfurimonas aquatica]|nr:hypothetical protein [Sulfurimonas aquatica]